MFNFSHQYVGIKLQNQQCTTCHIYYIKNIGFWQKKNYLVGHGSVHLLQMITICVERDLFHRKCKWHFFRYKRLYCDQKLISYQSNLNFLLFPENRQSRYLILAAVGRSLTLISTSSATPNWRPGQTTRVQPHQWILKLFYQTLSLRSRVVNSKSKAEKVDTILYHIFRTSNMKSIELDGRIWFSVRWRAE